MWSLEIFQESQFGVRLYEEKQMCRQAFFFNALFPIIWFMFIRGNFTLGFPIFLWSGKLLGTVQGTVWQVLLHHNFLFGRYWWTCSTLVLPLPSILRSLGFLQFWLYFKNIIHKWANLITKISLLIYYESFLKYYVSTVFLKNNHVLHYCHRVN